VVSICGFLELSAADDEQLNNNQFLKKTQNISKFISNKKKTRKSNTSAQFPQSIIDQTIETSLKEKATRCS
jgi:hypothetical protein